jgi:glycosyltransferase involved in cell wall biosynthesis
VPMRPRPAAQQSNNVLATAPDQQEASHELPEVVTALICTRNRPGPIVRAVASLLRPGSEPLELIVVDQSDGAETKQSLESFAADPRFRYVCSKGRGKGVALNEGTRLARGDIIVCTDDDCEAPPGWVMSMARALDSQATAAVAFCSVMPVPYDHKRGYVPAYELKRSRLLRSVSALCLGVGLGAGMALRREFVLEMGGLDERFGPGARFPSADDWDIAFRALLTGRHIYETSELSILHDGFRSFEEGREHSRRDWIALGAVCAKPLRAGYLRALVVPIWFVTSKAVWPAIVDLLHLRKPRIGRIIAFSRGFVAALGMPVDRQTLLFL